MLKELGIEGCPICDGVGWIDGEPEYYAGIKYPTMKHCSCVAGKLAKSNIASTGIKAEVFDKKTFGAYKPKNDHQKEMLRKAKVFAAGYKPGDSFGLFGSSGIGKSHLCLAACRQIVKDTGCSMKYFDYRKEIQRLRALFFKGNEFDTELKEWTNCDLLYIDDLFKFGHKDSELIQGEAQVMYQIINTRYLNGASTVFSSELAVGQIMTLDRAIGSRMAEMIGNNGYYYGDEQLNMRLQKEIENE